MCESAVLSSPVGSGLVSFIVTSQKGLMWVLFTCNEICIVRGPVAVSDTIVSSTDCEMCALSELAVFSMKRNAEISRIDRR